MRSIATLQLNLGLDFKSGSRVTVGLEQPASVEEVRTALEGHRGRRDHPGDQRAARPERLVIDSQIEPAGGPAHPAKLDEQFGIVERIQLDHGRAYVRRAGGAQRGLRDHLLAARDLRVHRVQVRAEVRRPGDHRLDPRHPDHGRRLLADGEGGDHGTVAAFLTILGYSLYDTVIVFDRIRENVPRLPRATFSQVVNRSMSEVLTRS